MQREFVDTYRAMRDGWKPAAGDLKPRQTPEQARRGYDTQVDAFAALHAFTGPSRGHLKRLARFRPEVTPAKPRLEPSLVPPRLAFFREQMRALNLPIDTGEREPLPRDTAAQERAQRAATAPRLTIEQQAIRVANLKAEFHRLARFMPAVDDVTGTNEWRARRMRALQDWQRAAKALDDAI